MQDESKVMSLQESNFAPSEAITEKLLHYEEKITNTMLTSWVLLMPTIIVQIFSFNLDIFCYMLLYEAIVFFGTAFFMIKWKLKIRQLLQTVANKDIK